MSDQAIKWLEAIVSFSQSICEVAKTASRGGKSLTGDNFYGNKFHELSVEIAAVEARVSGFLSNAGISAQHARDFGDHLAMIRAPKTGAPKRSEALKRLRLLVRTILMPAFEEQPAQPISQTEPVLPFAVVKGTRGYIENVVTQANVCYENRCFDACSVMIRKLLEMLLIELFETKGNQGLIKNGNGDYFMLSEIINTALQDLTLNFGRETKQALPRLKSLGDRSAHNRRYIATKRDVDNVIPGLRVSVDDLLHLAGVK
jgi:hypothetical protein